LARHLIVASLLSFVSIRPDQNVCRIIRLGGGSGGVGVFISTGGPTYLSDGGLFDVHDLTATAHAIDHGYVGMVEG
jgi:hypothetical protein